MRMTGKKQRNMRGIDVTMSRAFANYKPPEDLTVSQWAAKYRILSRESSAEAGPWRNERTPYLVEIMDAFTDPKVKEISVVAGSQSAKSEGELNMIGYIIDQDPSSTLYIQPTIDDAKKFSKLRIAPMIRDCSRLRAKVADIKSRDANNTVLQKSFPGGMLTMVGSQSASALASTPARYIIGDEIDRWALSAGTEGDPWSLAVARTTTFYNAKMVAVSTPTIKGFSRIESLYYGGTQEKWHHRCPECGAWHEIVFNDIKFDFETTKTGRRKSYKVKSVHWCCPSCGCVRSETDMRVQPARWAAENPDAIERGRRSFWINAFASPWRSWTEIVQMFLEAKDDPEKLKAYYNTILGELWEDRGDIEDEDTLLSRREEYGTRPDGSPIELPDGVLVLTCGVDTQDDRLEYEVVGHGHYGETWGIKKGIITGDPNDDEPWLRLDEVISHVYKFANGRGLTISMTFVDSGGHKTQSGYQHCRDRFNKRVFAIKGVGGDGVPFTKPPSKVKIIVNGRAIGETWLYTIGVDAGKADIMSNIKAQEAGAKFCHFPKGEERGYDITFFRGLLSEKLVMKTERGRTRWTWEKLPGHERNEALDCRNYALAAFRVMDPDLDAVERRLKGLNAPAQQNAQATEKKRGVVKRSSEVDEW
ncbi:MAG: phage terminase large subunit family protein [Clostridiales bacterium]|nr:phage terminase large subunit family protein [Clostridiales bacterium]